MRLPADDRIPRVPVARALFVLSLLAAMTATASTVVPMSVSDMIGRSRQIFHGVCVEAHADILDGDIVTRFRFAVAEGLKGVPTTDTLDVVLPGGTFEGIRYRITGMPNFAPGEEVVLFLTRPDSAGRVWPVGLAQGGFRVRRETDGPPRVRRNFAGLRFQGSARAAGIQADDLRLDDLLDEVRSLTGATATGGKP
jgi:hypothetical protein